MNFSKEISENFSLLVSKLIRKLKILDRDKEICCGLTVSQNYLIGILLDEGQMKITKLATQLGLAPSTLTRSIDVLERKEIVVRKDNPNDRSCLLFDLTDKGEKIANQLKECWHSYFQSVFTNIPEAKRGNVLEAIEILSHAINTYKK